MPGVKCWDSCAQLSTRLVGQTTMAGLPACSAWMRGSASQVSVWSVLPRPISSARMPPRRLASRKRSHETPSFWYGRRMLRSGSSSATGSSLDLRFWLSA